MKIDFSPKRVLSIDFSPRVFMRDRTHTYLFLREKKGKGQFLTMESGTIEIVRVPLEDGEYRVWKRNEGEVQDPKVTLIFYPLVPYEADPMRAINTYWASPLDKSPAAIRELRVLLGLPPSEEPEGYKERGSTSPKAAKTSTGASLADLCTELGIEGSAARKVLRKEQIEKPGDRWEWTDPEAAQKIKDLLIAAKIS